MIVNIKIFLTFSSFTQLRNLNKSFCVIVLLFAKIKGLNNMP